MMGPGYVMDPSYMGWMMIGSVVFWILLVAVAIFAIVRLGPSRGRASDAIATLEQRFARGEIDADEYTSRRSLILGH
jgi:putative membrane protein